MSEARFSLDRFELYQQAQEFRRAIDRLIRELPREERFALDPQMRRAAVSVTNNIAEGHGRWHYQENIQFCRIARGSVSEILDDLNVCLDESYGAPEVVSKLKQDGSTLIARINGYITYLERRKPGAVQDKKGPFPVPDTTHYSPLTPIAPLADRGRADE